MTSIVKYATRSDILVKDSLFAIDVNGETILQPCRAEGLVLEGAACVQAILEARSQNLAGFRLEVTPELLERIQSPWMDRDETRSDRIYHNIRRLLETSTCDVVAAPVDPDLQLLLSHQPAGEESNWELDPQDAQWVEENNATIVYTDGSCHSSLVGAWAWYIDENRHAAGPLEHAATSFTTERRALREAIEANPGPLLILSDCATVSYGVDGALAALSMRDPVWHLLQTSRVRLAHVKGHATCRGNLRADRLARMALARRLQELDDNPLMLQKHQENAALVSHRLERRQKERQTRIEWFATRRQELIRELHPTWKTMNMSEREVAGRAIYAQCTREFHASHALVAA